MLQTFEVQREWYNNQHKKNEGTCGNTAIARVSLSSIGTNYVRRYKLEIIYYHIFPSDINIKDLEQFPNNHVMSGA